MTKLAVCTLFLTALFSSGCEMPTEALAGPTTTAVRMEITAARWTLYPSESLQLSVFGLTGTGDTALSLPVTYTASGGTITPTGLYTAGEAAGQYLVTATTTQGLSGSAVVTVQPVPAVPPASLPPVVIPPQPPSPIWSIVAALAPLLAQLLRWGKRYLEMRKEERERQKRRRIGFIVSLPLAALILAAIAVGMNSPIALYVTFAASAISLALLYVLTGSHPLHRTP